MWSLFKIHICRKLRVSLNAGVWCILTSRRAGLSASAELHVYHYNQRWSEHISGVVFLALFALPHQLKNIVNMNIYCIFLPKKSTEYLASQSHRTSRIRSMRASLYSVLDGNDRRLTIFTPLGPVNSRIDNVVVRIAPQLNQPLFQFINAIDVYIATRCCMVAYYISHTRTVVRECCKGDDASQ